MIIIAELQMQGERHAQVNAGLIEIVRSSFVEEDLKIYCDEQHKGSIIKLIKDSGRLSFETFKYTGDKELAKISIFNKIIREVKLSKSIFREASKKGVRFIIFSSAFPFTALFLNFFARRFDQKIIVCLHGDLGILSLKKRKLTTLVVRYSIKSFFIKRNGQTIVLFYGECIMRKTFELFPKFNNRNVIAIDHPYFYNELSKLKRINNTFIIANIGTALMIKNSHFLYELALMQRRNIDDFRLKLVQIGNVSSEVLKRANPFVDIVNKSKFLPSSLFEKYLGMTDYFIYFFVNNSYYDLCPSGTFFDAIKYGKPIISLRNPFFEYYFEKLGDIGYLCNSLIEMNAIINQIIYNRDEIHYCAQVETLIRARRILSIKSISESFSSQLMKIM